MVAISYSVEVEQPRDAHGQPDDPVAVRVGVAVPERQHGQQRVERVGRIDPERRDGVGEPREADLALRLERLAPAPRVCRRAVPVHAALDGLAQPLAAERLHQVVEHALSQARHRRSHVVNRRRHDDGRFGVLAAQVFGQPQPVVARQADVAQGDRDRVGLHGVQRLLRVRRFLHHEAARLEPVRHEVAHAVLVVHHEYRPFELLIQHGALLRRGAGRTLRAPGPQATNFAKSLPAEPRVFQSIAAASRALGGPATVRSVRVCTTTARVRQRPPAAPLGPPGGRASGRAPGG